MTCTTQQIFCFINILNHLIQFDPFVFCLRQDSQSMVDTLNRPICWAQSWVISIHFKMCMFNVQYLITHKHDVKEGAEYGSLWDTKSDWKRLREMIIITDTWVSTFKVWRKPLQAYVTATIHCNLCMISSYVVRTLYRQSYTLCFKIFDKIEIGL